MSSFRGAVALVLWAAAGLLTLFLVFSGWWIFAPFVFAGGGGGDLLVLPLAIVGFAVAAYLVGRRAPG